MTLTETGSAAALTTSTSVVSSVDVQCSVSTAANAVSSPGNVLAGFTPTVASITEQNSLEIFESSFDLDFATETPPPSDVDDGPKSG